VYNKIAELYNKAILLQAFNSMDNFITPPQNIPNNLGGMNYSQIIPPPEPEQPRSNKKFFFIIIIVLLLVGGLSAAGYYVVTTGLFSGAPYDNDHVISGLVNGISKIKTSSYYFSLTGQSEPKEANAVPFSIVVKGDGREELLKKDQDTFRDLQSVISKLTTYSLQHRKSTSSGTRTVYTYMYPSTLTAAGVNADLAKKFKYAQTDEGKGYTITVAFETGEAVDTAKQSGAKIVSGKTVEISGKNGSSMYFYFSGKSREAEFAEIFRSQEQYLQMVPRDYKLAVSLLGAAERTNDNKIENGQLAFKGDVTVSGSSFGIDVEGRKIGETYYGIINKIPFFFGTYSDIIGKWIKIPPEEAGTYAGGFFRLDPKEIQDEYSKNKEEVQDRLLTFVNVAEKNHLLIVEGTPAKEQLNGEAVYKYNLTFDKNNIVAFYKDITKTYTDKYPKSGPYFDQATLDFLESDEFGQVVNYLKSNSSLTIWFNTGGIPVKYSYGMRVVPSNKSKIADDRQIRHTVELTLKDVNKKVKIETPANSINLEDAIIAISGITKEEYTYQKRVTEITNLRSALSSYVGSNSYFYGDDLMPSIDSKPNTKNYPSLLSDLLTATNTYPQIKKLPKDVSYKVTSGGKDYELVYHISLPKYTKGSSISQYYSTLYPQSTRSSSYNSYSYYLKFVDGENTATKARLSEEAYAAASKDADNDMLSDSLETFIGSNKSKKDTDGDGYSDGEELRSNSNPLGTGQLEYSRGGF
jgi:hypothetical protein